MSWYAAHLIMWVKLKGKRKPVFLAGRTLF